MIVCFLFAGNFIAAAKWVQLAIWFWAGVSKCTVAFKYVVPIMTSNNSFMKSQFFRRQLFVDPPDDVTPSGLARLMAHGGGFLEFAAALTLVWVTGEGPLLYVGMFFAVFLHLFIISNMPIAAVFEWNVLNLFTAYFLFWGHPEVSLFDVGSIPFSILLVVILVIVPVLGNVVPKWVSFLLSMRYYAGNWAWNAWLFKGESYNKRDKLKRVAPLLFQQQLQHLGTADALRAMQPFSPFARFTSRVEFSDGCFRA